MREFSPENSLVVVPARDGSKRIPNKNSKRLGGKALIEWTLDVALKCDQLGHVYVSTDSIKIAELAKAHGALVPKLRSAETAVDSAPTNMAITEAIEIYEALYERVVQWIVLLQPTSPFRTIESLQRAIECFHMGGGNTLVSVTREYYPLKWLVEIDDDGALIPAEISAQDKQALYKYNGAIYIFTRSTLSANGDIYSPIITPFLMESSVESIDIDTPEDWDLASLVAQSLSARQ